MLKLKRGNITDGSAPPSVRHTTTQTHTHTWIFPNFSEARNNPLFSLYIPAESLWILTELGGVTGGAQKNHPGPATAEQTWNFDLREDSNIPRWQAGCYLSKQHLHRNWTHHHQIYPNCSHSVQPDLKANIFYIDIFKRSGIQFKDVLFIKCVYNTFSHSRFDFNCWT